jgi:hypothetical protein
MQITGGLNISGRGGKHGENSLLIMGWTIISQLKNLGKILTRSYKILDNLLVRSCKILPRPCLDIAKILSRFFNRLSIGNESLYLVGVQRSPQGEQATSKMDVPRTM